MKKKIGIRKTVIKMEEFFNSLSENETFSKYDILDVYPYLNIGLIEDIMTKLRHEGIIRMLTYNKWIFTGNPIPDVYKNMLEKSGRNNHETEMLKSKTIAKRKNDKHIKIIKDLGFSDLLPLLQTV